MALSYYADRANLYRLHQQHPHWTQQHLAEALERRTVTDRAGDGLAIAACHQRRAFGCVPPLDQILGCQELQLGIIVDSICGILLP